VVDGKVVDLKDHSVFVAFAPREHPRIAIAVIVENAGTGAAFAVPIANLMMEKYLRGFPACCKNDGDEADAGKRVLFRRLSWHCPGSIL
jgi:hypothetical protein